LYNANYDIIRLEFFAISDSNFEEIFTKFFARPLPIFGKGILVMAYFALSRTFSSLVAVLHNKESWVSMELSRNKVCNNWFMTF
jgi:hypothetical protein